MRVAPGEVLPANVYIVGRVPHQWLLPKVAAVIHHGGAGTVGAGLALALPTMCCPFFGDQHFYAHACGAIGVGPPPIDFDHLSTERGAERLAAALAEIGAPRFKEAATRIAAQINAEAQALGGHARVTEDLLDEVAALVEWPVAITGHFEARFLELPPQFINREEVTERLRRFDSEDQRFLDSVGVQFRKLNFNDSIWVPASRVIEEIPPLTFENEGEYLKKSQFFELEDDAGVYLAEVRDVMEVDAIAPLSYIEPTIRQVLLNRRKLGYLRRLENELIDEAIQQKELQIYEANE